MPATTGTFAAVGLSVNARAVNSGEMAVSLTGPFVATVILEEAISGGSSGFKTVATYRAPATDSVKVSPGAAFRLRCSSYTSGTVTYSFQPPGPFAPTLGPLPTSSDGLPPNALWNNAGVVSIV